MCLAVLLSGGVASASGTDACALVPLAQVQSVIGADGTVANRTPPQSRNGATGSYCVYQSKALSASTGYFTFASGAQAQSALEGMKMRSRGRGNYSISGTKIVSAFVNDNSTAHSEQKNLSDKLVSVMLHDL